MTVLPRIATSPELAKLRSDNQSSRLYLTVHAPATIFTARLAAVPSTTDQITSITYNTGSGAGYANIITDQTVLVGSTAGGFEDGQCRIRSLSGLGGTTGTFYIGEESEVNFQANAFLTVIDELPPWPKHIKMASDGTTPVIDGVTYTDQHDKCDSIPVLGPHRVAWLNASTVTISFDASQSWALNNSINGYAWTFPGALSYTNETTATPTATYNATGVYRVACAISNDDTVTFTGYRYVFIVTESTVIDQFSCDSIRGDYSTGGWSFDVKMYAQADRTTIRDRAMVILHSVDYYGDVAGSVGYVAGSENVIAIGYIAGETIDWQPEDKSGSVTFRVEGLQYWLDKISAFPEGLKDVTTTPNKWTKFYQLSTKAAVWHMLHWRTTITKSNDVFPLDNTHRAARIEAPGAQSLWQQLNTMLDQALLAKACCDRYGRVFCQIEQQVLNSTEKTGIPSVMTLTGEDWTGAIDFERVTTPVCSLFDLSGVSFDGSNATPYFSLSPGHVFKRLGSPDIRDRLIIDSQTVCNQRAGAYVGWKNNPYPRIPIELAENNRMFDIAPWQYATLNIAAGDTVRGIIASSLRIIPRSIEYVFQNGYMITHGDFEAESVADISITHDRPPVTITPLEPPVIPPVIVPPVPTPTASGKEVWGWHYNATATPANCIFYDAAFFTHPANPVWAAVASLPADLASITGGSIRGDGATLYVVGNSTASPSRIEMWKTSNPKASPPTWTKCVTYGGSFTGNTIGGVTVTIGNITSFDESVNGYVALTSALTSPLTPTLGGLFIAETNEGGQTVHRGKPRLMPNGTTDNPLTLWNNINVINAPRKLIKTAGGYGATGFQNVAGGWGYVGIPDAWNTYQVAPNLGLPFFNGMYGQVLNTIAYRKLGIPSSGGNTAWQTLYNLPIAGTPTISINGSFYGTSIYALCDSVYGGGEYRVHYSLNGRDFAQSSTDHWSYGKILSANLSGGTYCLWALCRSYFNGGDITVTNSNEFLRYSTDIAHTGASPWTSSTGNLWTNIITAGNLTLVNMAVVYT